MNIPHLVDTVRGVVKMFAVEIGRSCGTHPHPIFTHMNIP